MNFDFSKIPEVVYLTGGAVAAFFMAFLRSLRYTRKQLAVRIVESFMCAMLTASFAVGLHAYWHISFVWSIPIGTMVGFLGTDFIRTIVIGVIEYRTMKYTDGDYRERREARIAREDKEHNSSSNEKP